MKTFLGIGLGPIQTGIFVSGASKGNFDRIVVAEVDDTIREAIRAAGGTITINIAAPDRVYTEVCKNIEVYSPAKLRAQAEAEYNERMKNAAKEEKRKRQTEDLNAVSEYEGEKLTQKEINRRKLAAARKADAEKYGEEYHEDNDDDT